MTTRRIRLGYGIGMLACAVLFAGAVCVRGETAKNIVLLIGDGMGFEQIKAGACFTGTNLVFEQWAKRGEMTTRSANAAITDSAASGTAMATGHKVNNGVISLAQPGDGSEYETVLEWLQRHGKRTGLITTTSLTHATPAAFGAHETNRNSMAAIAADFLTQSRPNVLLGGGGSGLTVAAAAAAGYTVVTNRAEMQALDTAAETRVSGLFGNGNMPFELTGPGELPHLREMTQTALDLLGRSTNGFFLMVEGGRIDHACHAHDIARCVREVEEFDKTVRVAVEWTRNRTDTLIIVAADHETGGLTVATNNGAGNEPSVTWSSLQHTGTNVGVFAVGPGSDGVAGVIDNTDIYQIIMRTQTVVPRARAIQASTNRTVTHWEAQPAGVVLLEAASNLRESHWSPIAKITAQTHEVRLIDTNTGTDWVRFYRLIAEP